jgi:hypothetical protein
MKRVGQWIDQRKVVMRVVRQATEEANAKAEKTRDVERLLLAR